MADFPRRSLSGLGVAVLTSSDGIHLIATAISARARLVVAFCNAHTVNVAANDPALVDALDDALLLNDGIGVDLASRLIYGRSFPENLNGTDFTPALLSAVQTPLRLALFGAAPGVSERAGLMLVQRYPHHHIVGTWHGYFAAEDRAAIMRVVAATQPDLVLVAMGQPRQEFWARDYVTVHGGVAMCVGAYLDFAAGIVPRAPTIFRTLRLEWVFRLLIEPRRLWKRYLVGNLRFLIRAARQAVRERAR